MNSKPKTIVLHMLVIGLLLGFSQSITAQKKPSTDKRAHSLEIRLTPENDDSHFEGNSRILNRTGYAAAIYQSTFRVRNADPEIQAREYLTANQNLLGLNTDDIQSLRLHAIRKDAAGTVVRLRQTWKGLPVNKNAEITIHISHKDIVDFVTSSFQYGISMESVEPLLSVSAAGRTVFDHLGIAGENVVDLKSELMVLRYQDTDYLVHRVNFITDELVGDWEAYIDAKTGNLLKVEDIAIYRQRKGERKRPVVPQTPDSLLVNGNGNVFDPDPLTSALAPYGGAYSDGNDANNASLTAELKNVTLLDITNNGGTFSLVGPYAEIQDFESPFKGLFTQASSTFNFNRSDDAFEAVNTYYHIDTAMRHLNVTLGLNIMPYQYSGGVRFDPSGLNGSDNSHYLSGSGRLAFGEGGVDDAEDADVIVHELGHGLHDWVTSGGLSQVNGLSEGSGDYFAGSYSRALGFWTPSNPAYHWMFNWDGHNPFWPGRILNYSATYPGGLTGSIHTDGQIWATVMMKVWDDIGRDKADKAFWTGLGLTNGSSNQNDAANAVFTAALNMNYSNSELLAIHTRLTAAGYTLPPFTPTNPSSTKFDFDGDSKTDIGIFRPAPGEWWYLRSSDGGNSAFQFGQSTDSIVPADFTGDGKTDIAFWRPSSGEWFILRSEDSSFYAFPFGQNGDIPVPGDFDGDGKADPAVFRPSNATWYYIRSSDGGSPAVQFGLTGDVPIVEDYDGDGTDDLSVYRPSVSEWFLQRSTDGFIGFQFGTPGDTTPVPADFTGDAKADIAFFKPSSNEWFVLRSEDSSFFAFPFGTNGDIPVPGDYDGDGSADPAVFRPSNNTWYLNQSTAGSAAIQFGIANDVPVPSAYAP